MPTLIETCEELRLGLKSVRVANQTRQEMAAVQLRTKEWMQHINTRRVLEVKVQTVDPEIFDNEEVKHSNSVVTALTDKAKKKLLAGLNVQSLADEDLWLKLTLGAGAANTLIESIATKAWAQFVQTLGRVIDPDILESRMLNTPDNIALLSTYRQKFIEYKKLIGLALPTGNEVKVAIEKMTPVLQAIGDQLISDAPESVLLFLKNIDGIGTPLELVTPEVIDWLKINDDLARFVVKSKSKPTWR